MAHIKIVDTGYPNNQRELGSGGSIESSKANNGSAIDIKYADITQYTGGNSVDASPQPGTFESVEANYIGVENRRWNVAVNLHLDDTSDHTVIKHLLGEIDSSTYPGLDRTAGTKALYISGTSDVKKSIVELMGSTDTPFHGQEVPSELPAFIGHVKNMGATLGKDDNVIRVTFTFVEG